MEPPHADITVIAHPGSRKEAISIDDQDKYVHVHVTAPPEKGKANKAIIKLIAKKLNVVSSSITIIRGTMNSTKVLRVEGLNTNDAMVALDPGK
ncbi:MAG: DUF167 domain-containing protein [Candidatus Lokiarchaeota archaeon]|nr:DUF167 domain-containing protein [Candidatus Lokiarchaeota archaeon]